MFYISLFTFGAATTITEWKKIAATTKQKIFYTFTFPLSLFTYVPDCHRSPGAQGGVAAHQAYCHGVLLRYRVCGLPWQRVARHGS